mmetsp:Transcript_67140/g.187894  ORF Transcript_67140/g.187894 Transcript_67140/m.187894 type:complete len:206 (+) Transcript_67140:535-1152(+)
MRSCYDDQGHQISIPGKCLHREALVVQPSAETGPSMKCRCERLWPQHPEGGAHVDAEGPRQAARHDVRGLRIPVRGPSIPDDEAHAVERPLARGWRLRRRAGRIALDARAHDVAEENELIPEGRVAHQVQHKRCGGQALRGLLRGRSRRAPWRAARNIGPEAKPAAEAVERGAERSRGRPVGALQACLERLPHLVPVFRRRHLRR